MAAENNLKASASSDEGVRWRRRKEDRPGELIEAACALFVEQGFKATRLDDVAKRAGVSKGTVYLYFDNKEALLDAVVKESVLPLVELGEQMAQDIVDSPTALIERIIWRWCEEFEHGRVSGVTKLVIAEAGNFPKLARFFMTDVAERLRRLFAAILQRGMDQGLYRDLDVDGAVRVLMSPMLYASIYDHSLAPFDSQPCRVQRLVRSHLDIFIRGIGKD